MHLISFALRRGRLSLVEKDTNLNISVIKNAIRISMKLDRGNRSIGIEAGFLVEGRIPQGRSGGRGLSKNVQW